MHAYLSKSMPKLPNLESVGLTVVEEDHSSAVPAFKHFLMCPLTYGRETVGHNRGREIEPPDRRLRSAASTTVRRQEWYRPRRSHVVACASSQMLLYRLSWAMARTGRRPLAEMVGPRERKWVQRCRRK